MQIYAYHHIAWVALLTALAISFTKELLATAVSDPCSIALPVFLDRRDNLYSLLKLAVSTLALLFLYRCNVVDSHPLPRPYKR